MNNDAPADKTNEPEPSLDLIAVLAFLWRQKRWLAAFWAICTITAVIVAFILPPQYESDVSFLTVSSNSSTPDLSSIAALAGVNLPVQAANDPGANLLAVLNSRTLAAAVVEETKLDNFLPNLPKNPEARIRSTIVTLQKSLLVISSGSNGETILTFNTGDPGLSKALADSYIKNLVKLLDDSNFAISKKNREDLERQIDAQTTKLNLLQSDLIAFQAKFGLVDPKSQTQGNIQMVGNLMQQLLTLNVQIGTLAMSVSEDNPKLRSLRETAKEVQQQIDRINKQASSSSFDLGNMNPQVLLQYQNKLRDIDVAQKIFVALLSSIETVRLKEDAGAVYIQVLDPALLAQGPSGPNKVLIVGLGTFGGLFFSIFCLIAIRALQSLKPRWDQLRLATNPSQEKTQ